MHNDGYRGGRGRPSNPWDEPYWRGVEKGVEGGKAVVDQSVAKSEDEKKAEEGDGGKGGARVEEEGEWEDVLECDD